MWANLLTSPARTTVLRNIQGGVEGRTSTDQSLTKKKLDTVGTKTVVNNGWQGAQEMVNSYAKILPMSTTTTVTSVAPTSS